MYVLYGKYQHQKFTSISSSVHIEPASLFNTQVQGITAVKSVIWGGKQRVSWSQISQNALCNHKLTIYLPKLQFSVHYPHYYALPNIFILQSVLNCTHSKTICKVKLDSSQLEVTFHNEIVFVIVYHRIHCCSFLTLPNQTLGYIHMCIRILGIYT